MKFFRGLILFVFLSACFFAKAQQLTLPLNTAFSADIEEALYSPDTSFHTSIKPFVEADVQKVFPLDAFRSAQLLGTPTPSRFFGWLHEKAFNEHFFQVRTEDFYLDIDPVFAFEPGKDFSAIEDLRFVNTRGVQAQGSIGKKFSFFTSFYENQATFVDYVDERIRNTRVVPGQGMARNFYSSGFDYGYSSGHISYAPSKYLNIQAGHGKNFYGDGYRSLLLSDYAFNYPFLKLNVEAWKLKYSIMYAQFQDLKVPHGGNIGFQKKYGTFHFLNYAVNRRLQLGLYEAVIWINEDSTGHRGFDVNYLNPVIFFRPVEFSLGSPDNVLIGLNASYKLRKKNVLYAQFLLDELKVHEILSGDGWWGNKSALQAGFRTYDLAGLDGLSLQSEVNFVRPYTYSSRTSTLCYGHYNEALAHPLGANFIESVNILKYHYKRIYAQLKYNYIVYGADSAGLNYGNDIWQSYTTRPFEYGNFVGQGDKTTVNIFDASVSYLVNPATNMNVTLGLMRRTADSYFNDNECTFVYFGFRTSLNNLYYDF